jgi:hypothetical protein
MTININYTTLINISRSNKDFLLFDLNDSKDKIVCYKLTSDLQRYKKNFQHFRVVSTLKNEIRNLKISI